MLVIIKSTKIYVWLHEFGDIIIKQNIFLIKWEFNVV